MTGAPLSPVPLPAALPDNLVDPERRWVARELHDIVGYITAIVAHADIAAGQLGRRPGQVAESLEQISAVSWEAARELRAMLAVLRRQGGGKSALANPGVGGLDVLAATATSAGVPTRVARRGRPRPLPAAVDQAVYRIVQESLTNVLRHAGTANASIRLAYEPNRVVVEVVDDGDGRRPEDARLLLDGGHGIAGMRERALTFGGELEAAQRPGGGFRVRASLPFGGAPTG